MGEKLKTFVEIIGLVRSLVVEFVLWEIVNMRHCVAKTRGNGCGWSGDRSVLLLVTNSGGATIPEVEHDGSAAKGTI